MKHTPQWLENSVIEGLQMLLTLRLRNAPASDTIDAVVDVWVALFAARPIGWDEQRDTPRLHQAFAKVGGKLDYWPAPANVLEAMPPPPIQPLLRPPKSTIPPHEHQRRMDKVKALLERKTVRTPHQKSAIEQHNQALIQALAHKEKQA